MVSLQRWFASSLKTLEPGTATYAETVDHSRGFQIRVPLKLGKPGNPEMSIRDEVRTLRHPYLSPIRSDLPQSNLFSRIKCAEALHNSGPSSVRQLRPPEAAPARRRSGNRGLFCPLNHFLRPIRYQPAIRNRICLGGLEVNCHAYPEPCHMGRSV